MGKLSVPQIDDYFEKHLPYRTRIMLAHYKMTHDANGNRKAWTGDPGWVDACFIASLVTTRLYFNVLGMGKVDGQLGHFQPKPDDVTVDDLGGKRVDTTMLPASEKALLFDFLRMADKAAAHFTIPIQHDCSKTHDVVRIIHGYLQTHLYAQAGRTGLESMV